ncbi:MAG: hypothetical protein IJQ33_10785 [Clostridia bacterium]|nr:hypothetical protein [Clostridia bacterium]
MKKLLCMLICLILLVPSALAETAPVKLNESEPLYTSLYERSMELAGLFNEALHSEAYLSFLSLPSDFQEELALIQMQDFTQPLDVTIICGENALSSNNISEVFVLLEQAGLSPALAALIQQQIYTNIGAVLLNQSGASTLALSSSMRLTDAYIKPEEMSDPCFVVMQYGGLYAFLVTFYPTANNTVLAEARFIPSRAVDGLNLPVE